VKYLLDTNICIYIINQRSPHVRQRFAAVSVGDIAVSTVTLAELFYGVEESSNPARNLSALHKFLIPLVVLPYDEGAAATYGKVRRVLEKAGTPIGPMDLMIAAHALAARLTVVTNNVREFRRVSGLLVEDWSKPAAS
jgi:tRNA(fMet)-specific endonuclease VapC